MNTITENTINLIKKRISEYEEIANDLAHGYIQSDRPFPDDLKQRYEAIGNITDGLHEAITIILNGEDHV